MEQRLFQEVHLRGVPSPRLLAKRDWISVGNRLGGRLKNPLNPFSRKVDIAFGEDEAEVFFGIKSDLSEDCDCA